MSFMNFLFMCAPHQYCRCCCSAINKGRNMLKNGGVEKG